ncbi:MAG: hypothetical protein WAZ14_02495 [Patescibacteria group bacterium]
MQDVLDTGKRVLTAAIAAATIAFSIGAGALVSPLTAQAAVADGQLIKGTSLSTVYYKGYDGLRYAFPNEKTYFSWYANFSGVQTISDSELAGITLGGNIVVRPGTHFVKVTSDAKTYAVGRNGMLHWIESEAAAVDLAGSNWAANIIDIPDVFFDDYTVGTSLMSASAFEGAVYMMGGVTYLSWDGEMREVTASGMTANNIWSKFVLDGSNIDDSSLAMGADITSRVLALVDAAQTEEGETAVTGDLTLSESSSMPAGVSVTGGANAVEVFSFKADAGSEDASLDSLVLSMIGAGSTSNISAIYLYEGNSRLTESRSINASTRQVTFSNLGLDVEAGDDRTFTVRVTMSTTQTAADTFGFEIASASDVTSSGDVGGSFPIEGNVFTLTGSDSGTVTVTKTGTISDPTIGEDDAEIGMFKVTASGSESASLEMMTLNVDDAIDHTDYKLWDGNVFLASGSIVGNDLVAFDMSASPFEIEEGGNNIFTVTANIGGQDAETVKVFIDNAIDVVAIGGDFGFGMTVDTGSSGTYDGTSCTSSSGNCSFSTIVGGEVTIAFNGPTAGDIQVDSQDQVLLAFSITAAQEVTVKDLDIMVAADDDNDGDPNDGVETGAGTEDDDGLINTGSEANVKDIKIVNADTGATLLSPLELDVVIDDESDETSLIGAAEDALQIIDFTDDFTIGAGETLNLLVTVDVDNSLTSGETLSATFDISGLSIEDANGDALSGSDIVPGSDLTGYNQVAKAATLTFSLSSTPGDVTTVDGTDDVTVVAFNAAASEASDVTITDFTLSAYGDDDGDETMTLGGETNADVNDYVESCSLFNGDTLLDGPEGPATSGETIRFADIDWMIDAGSTELMTVKCNFANTSVSGSAYFSFDINDEDTDVVAEDDDGDTLAAASVVGDDPNGATAPNNQVTLADSGTLAVTAASGTPSADFVLTSSTANEVATYRFTATNEAFEIQTLTFSEEQAEDDLASADSTGYANNISLVTITYPKADGSTGTKSVAMSGNEAKFSALDMYVAVGTPADVSVKVSVPLTDRDAGGSATSNEKVRMGLFVDTTNDDNFKAVGAGSGATLDDDDQGAVGNDAVGTDGIHTFVVRETKPTVTLSSLSPSGSAVVGRSEVLRFNIAASSNEDVVLSRFTFKMNATDNVNTGTNDWNACDNAADAGEMAPQDFDIYNLTDDGTTTTLDLDSDTDQNDTLAEMSGGTDSPWTLLKATGAICNSTEADVGFVHLVLPTTEIVPKGVTKTFAIYLDTTGASAAQDDSIRLDIPSDPITGTFVDSTTDSNVAALAATATTLGVDSSAVFAIGDVIVLDADGAGGDGVDAADERMLVTALASGTTLTVVRGYLGSPLVATADVSNDDTIYRLPSSFLWKDDGVTGHTGSSDDFWGSYLVDNTTVSGGTLVF